VSAFWTARSPDDYGFFTGISDGPFDPPYQARPT